MKEAVVIILCIIVIVSMFGIIASRTEKENFMAICEGEGNSEDFCENSWKIEKEKL